MCFPNKEGQVMTTWWQYDAGNRPLTSMYHGLNSLYAVKRNMSWNRNWANVFPLQCNYMQCQFPGNVAQGRNHWQWRRVGRRIGQMCFPNNMIPRHVVQETTMNRNQKRMCFPNNIIPWQCGARKRLHWLSSLAVRRRSWKKNWAGLFSLQFRSMWCKEETTSREEESVEGGRGIGRMCFPYNSIACGARKNPLLGKRSQ